MKQFACSRQTAGVERMSADYDLFLLNFLQLSLDHRTPVILFLFLWRTLRRYRTWSWRMRWSRCGRSSVITRCSLWSTPVNHSRCSSCSTRQTSSQSAVATSVKTRCHITLIQLSASTSLTDTRTMHWSFWSRWNQTVGTPWPSSSRSRDIMHPSLSLSLLFVSTACWANSTAVCVCVLTSVVTVLKIS